MKVTTLTYHQRSIITPISTFLSVRPATCMDWRLRFCLNFGNFFFRSQFLQKNKPGQQRNLFDAINDFNKIIGELLTTLHHARSPESPGGVDLTAEEKMKVKKAIVNLEKILLTLQIAVGED